MKNIILCNGAFPLHSIPLQYITADNRIICCDGSAVKLLDYGIIPYAIVGDLDSLPLAIKTKYASIVHHNPCQDTNDLTKAVNWCIEQQLNDLIILGATGLREDHSLGNIALLSIYNRQVSASMFTDTGTFVAIHQSTQLASHIGQQVSIFALTPNVLISSKGLKYALSNNHFKNWHEGTLNEALGDEFELIFDEGEVLVYRSY